MEVAIVGAGYVGLVTATCLAELGHNVCCIDNVSEKISRLSVGDVHIYEPSLSDLVKKNLDAGSISFSTDLGGAVSKADLVFIAVGTPIDQDTGHADLSYVRSVVNDISKNLNGFTVIVNKSTVPVGTGAEVAAMLGENNSPSEFAVVSNPEFLREGMAVNDFMSPDRIVIGTDCPEAIKVMEQVYQPLVSKGVPILNTTIESAELIKYAANAFLATKISFINEISNLCEKVGGDVNEVAKGIGMDTRIGEKFLQVGPGYGGSCFPKDTAALLKTAETNGVDLSVVAATVDANNARKVGMVKRVEEFYGGSIKGLQVSVLGLTFKAGTDDMREAPSLTIVEGLVQAGANVKAYDPEGTENAKQCFADSISYAKDMSECLTGGDCVVVLTEWEEFKQLSLADLKDIYGVGAVFDFRNIFNKADAKSVGLKYMCLGSS